MTQLSKLSSIGQLNDKLNQEECVIRYRQLAKKVHEHPRINQLYREYIQLQKELVRLEYEGNQKRISQKERELKEIEAKLYDFPLFNEYIQLQVELNELFLMMTHIIQYKVNKHLSE